MKNYGGNLCPRIQKKLEKAKEMSFDCETTYAGEMDITKFALMGKTQW